MKESENIGLLARLHYKNNVNVRSRGVFAASDNLVERSHPAKPAFHRM